MKNRILVLLLVLALALPAAGCFEKATVESLLEDCAAKLEKTESYEINAKVNADIDIQGEALDVGIVAKGKLKGSITDSAIHLDGEFSYSAADDKDSAEFEIYLIEDKDEISAYAREDEEWSEFVIDEDDDDFEDAQKALEAIKFHKMIELLVDYEKDLELAKKTEKVGKIDAYVIEGTVSGDYITDFVKSIDVDELTDELDEALEDGDMDLGDYEVSIRLMIDKKTKLPVLLELDLKDTAQTILEDLLTALMSFDIPDFDYEDYDDYEDDEDEEPEPSEPEVEVNVKICVFEIEFSEFDDVKKIKVPKDVIDEARTESERIEEHNEAIESVYDSLFDD